MALDVVEMHERCSDEVDVGGLYATLHGAGLHYGPAFRTLESGARGDGEALALLRRRAQWQGTRVHPADLDGALQLTSVLASGEGSGETWLPFAVDAALLRCAAVRLLWAVRRCFSRPPGPSRARADSSCAPRVAVGEFDGSGEQRGADG